MNLRNVHSIIRTDRCDGSRNRIPASRSPGRRTYDPMNRSLSHIDLNCDVGEAATPEQLDIERCMIEHVTSVNIACGLHAGSPDLMRDTLRFAGQRGCAVGAHPGFPDRDAFGRAEQCRPAFAIETMVTYQIGAL